MRAFAIRDRFSVAVPVVFEGHIISGLLCMRVRPAVGPPSSNVITEVHDQIELFFRHMFIRRVESLFGNASGECES